MWDKIRRKLSEACDVLELFMALAVIVGLVIAILSVYPDIIQFWQNRTNPGAFTEFLDAVFSIVVGIEFMKMLCKPNSANIIEALIFLMARHMIIQTTSATDNLLSVISICILFLFRRFMLMTKPSKQNEVPSIIHLMKLAQNQEFRKLLWKLQQEQVYEKASDVEKPASEKNSILDEKQEEEETDIDHFQWDDLMDRRDNT